MDATCFYHTHVTVCISFSSVLSVGNLLSNVDNSLIIYRNQFFSTTRGEEWTECPAKRKKIEEVEQKNV